jgi:cysteine desulfurase/selenocysteine lyase
MTRLAVRAVDSKRENGDVGIAKTAFFDPLAIRDDFPILSRKINGRRLVYLDNAATTQKPRSVIAGIKSYYEQHNANVHRGLHTLAEEATAAYEATRDKVAEFIGGAKREEIIFTRNATESINVVALSWGRKNLRSGDRIVTTQMEHHANLIPWIVLAKATGAELEYIPIDDNGYLDLKNVAGIINGRTKLVAVTHMSNVLGTINPIEEIVELAHHRNARVLLDGAQSVPHLPVDIKKLGVDFMAFSAHKMLGPTGIGVLYGKEELLENMEPVLFGGEMISEVRFDSAQWASLPWKFEAGTPNIADAVAFSEALEYLRKIGLEKVREHELDLTEYALEKIAALNFVKIFGPGNCRHRGGIISFIDPQVHPHDLATFLDTRGIAIRAGHHCAQPLTRLLGVNATARASFYIYNTREDIDELITALMAARRYFAHE